MEQAAANEAGQDKRGNRKVRTGVVVGDKMDKTVLVRLERTKLHARYKKYIRVAQRVKAHDKDNSCRVGDKVQLIESRPLSKDKRWRVHKVLRRAE